MAKTNVKKVKKYIKKLNLSQKYTELLLAFHKIEEVIVLYFGLLVQQF